MVQKTQLVRVYVGDIPKLKAKGVKIQKRIKSWTGKDIKIPMTRIISIFANTPTEISEGRIIRLSKKKIRRIRKI